jgi:hypothetical protein
VTGARLRGGLVSEYVSTDCPTGQITLTLSRDGGFTLALAIWDPVVRDHVGWRTLNGNWNAGEERLTLSSRARELSYGLEFEEGASAPDSRIATVLHWERSSLPTFADGFDLVARR